MTARQDWVRTGAYVALIVATVVLSYATLRDRALHSGFPAWAAWLYPPAVDATIIVASRTWRDTTLSPRTRGLAAVVTLAAIVAGVAAFVVEHADGGPVAVAFSAVVPLALASALVLTSWSATDRRDAALIATRAADEQQAVEDAARAEMELAQRQDQHERTRQERVLVASLASVLAIGARYTGPARPAGITTSPRRLTTEHTASPHRSRAVRSSPARGESGGEGMAAAVVWAVGELAAGRTAGWRRIASARELSEHHAKKAARAATEQHGTPALRAVERSAS